MVPQRLSGRDAGSPLLRSLASYPGNPDLAHVFGHLQAGGLSHESGLADRQNAGGDVPPRPPGGRSGETIRRRTKRVGLPKPHHQLRRSFNSTPPEVRPSIISTVRPDLFSRLQDVSFGYIL